MAERPSKRRCATWPLGNDALHMGNDALWSWWSARSETRIEGITLYDGTLRCRVTCAYPGGCVVTAPLGQQAGTPVATCDGQPRPCVTREEFGQTWAYIVVPPGGQHGQLGRWAKPA